MCVEETNHLVDNPLDMNSVQIVMRMIQFLSNDGSKLQHEAVMRIAEITSKNSQLTRTIVEAGAIEPLVRLLSSNDSEIQQNSLLALTNIFG